MNGTPTSPAPDLRRDLQIISDQLYVSWLDAIDRYGGAGSIADRIADAYEHLMRAREMLDLGVQPVRTEPESDRS